MKTDKNYEVLNDNFKSVTKAFLRKNARVAAHIKNANLTNQNHKVIGLSIIYPLVKVAYYKEQLNFLEEHFQALSSENYAEKFLLRNIEKATQELINAKRELHPIVGNKIPELNFVTNDLQNIAMDLNEYINAYGTHSLAVLPDVASMAIKMAKAHGVFKLMDCAHNYLNNGTKLYYQQHIKFLKLRKEGKMPGFPYKPGKNGGI